MKYLKYFNLNESLDFGDNNFLNINSLTEDDVEEFINSHTSEDGFSLRPNDDKVNDSDNIQLLDSLRPLKIKSIKESFKILKNQDGFKTIVDTLTGSCYIDMCNITTVSLQLNGKAVPERYRYQIIHVKVHLKALKDEYYIMIVNFDDISRRLYESYEYLIDGRDNIKSCMASIFRESKLI